MPLTLSPHVMQKEPGTRRDRIVKVIPYIRISKDHAPPIYLQQGKAYSEGGQLIKKANYPSWFYDELQKLTPQALQDTGWENVVHKVQKTEDVQSVEQTVEQEVITKKKPVRRMGRPRGSKNKKKKSVKKVESERPLVSESDGDSSSSRSVDI